MIELNIIIVYTAEEYFKTWFFFIFYPTLSSSKMEPCSQQKQQMKDAWIWKIKNTKILQYIIPVLHFLLYSYSKETYTEPIPGFQS